MSRKVNKRESPQMDYGRKPYIGDDDFVTMMRKRTEFSMYSKVDYPWSEFKRPYESDNYRDMEDTYNIPDVVKVPDIPTILPPEPPPIPEPPPLPPERVIWSGVVAYGKQFVSQGAGGDITYDYGALKLNNDLSPQMISYNSSGKHHVNKKPYKQWQTTPLIAYTDHTHFWVVTKHATHYEYKTEYVGKGNPMNAKRLYLLATHTDGSTSEYNILDCKLYAPNSGAVLATTHYAAKEEIFMKRVPPYKRIWVDSEGEAHEYTVYNYDFDYYQVSCGGTYPFVCVARGWKGDDVLYGFIYPGMGLNRVGWKSIAPYTVFSAYVGDWYNSVYSIVEEEMTFKTSNKNYYGTTSGIRTGGATIRTYCATSGHKNRYGNLNTRQTLIGSSNYHFNTNTFNGYVIPDGMQTLYAVPFQSTPMHVSIASLDVRQPARNGVTSLLGNFHLGTEGYIYPHELSYIPVLNFAVPNQNRVLRFLRYWDNEPVFDIIQKDAMLFSEDYVKGSYVNSIWNVGQGKQHLFHASVVDYYPRD